MAKNALWIVLFLLSPVLADAAGVYEHATHTCKQTSAVIDSAWSVCANLANQIFKHSQHSGQNLNGIKLLRAQLQGSDLSHSNLQGANLAFSELQQSNLAFSDLRYATLREANLYKADLRGADLRGANLRNARLADTILREAKFNASTILPFSDDKARRLGMQFLP